MPRARIVHFLEGRQRPFPDDPKARLDAMLPSINMEPKSAMMAFCLNDRRRMDEHHTIVDIRGDFLDIMGRGGWEPQESVFMNYAHGSLLPSGMVSEHTVKCEGCPRPVTVWHPTEAMERYGRPIAAFTLRYSVEKGRSIYATLSTKTAPRNRARMLELLREGKSTEAELIADIGLGNNNVMKHMRALRKEGLIGFETGNNEDGNGWARYRWKPGRKLNEVKPVGTIPTLTRKVARVLRAHGDYMSPTDARKAAGHKRMPEVSTVLRGLYKQGLLETGQWDTNLRSRIWLEDIGDAFLEEWFDCVIDALSEGPELACMQVTLGMFQRKPALRADYVGKAIDLYREVSLAGRKPAEERRREITDFVRGYQEEHGHGPRHVEIRDAIGVGVSNYLRRMDGELLRKVKNGKAVRYEII